MRRRGIVVSVVCASLCVAAMLLAGCGSSGSASNATTIATSAQGAGTASAASGTSSTQAGKLDRASALVFARAVNLRIGDVPGAALTARERERAQGKGAAALARCVGISGPPARLADLKSAAFALRSGGGLENVKSSVTVFPSSTYAASRFAAEESPRGRSCLARLLFRSLSPRLAAEVALGKPTVTSMPVSAAAGAHAAGVRVQVRVRPAAQRASVVVYVDGISLLDGPAEVNLTVVGLTQPPSTALESRLFKLLEERAHSHSV